MFDPDLPHDVVGVLSDQRVDKGFGTRLFAFAAIAVPAFARLAARSVRARSAIATAFGASSWWLFGAAATIAVTGSWAVRSDVLSSLGLASIAAAAAVGPAGAAAEAWLRRSGARRSTESSSASPGRGWFQRLNGPGADLVLGAACVTIAFVALGPRTLPDAPLIESITRIGGTFVCAGVALFGLCAALAPTRGWHAFALARPFVSLAAVRFVREDAAATAGAILATAALVWSLAWAWRWRGRDDGAHETAPPGPSHFAWNVAAPWLVLTLVFHFGAHGGLDLFHSGEWLTIGAMTRDGMAPFRDIYLQHGLVQNALRAAWTMEWVGDTLWADRVVTNALYGLTHAAFLWMLLPVLRSPYLALTVALAFATRGLYLQPRFIPLFVAIACLLRAIEAAHDFDAPELRRRARRLIAFAGCAAGVGVFWSLDIGVYTSFAAVLFFGLAAWIARARTPFVRGVAHAALPFVFGASLGAAPFVAYLAGQGALRAFVDNSILQATLQLPVWGLPFPSLRAWIASVADGDPKQFLGNGTFTAFFAPLVFVCACAAIGVRSLAGALSARDLQRLLLAIFGLVVYRTALGRSDAGHFAYAAALLWPLLLMFAEDAWRARVGPLRVVPACLLVGFLFTAFEPAYALVRQWTRIAEVQPELPGGGFSYAPMRRMRDVLIPDAQAQTLTALKSWLDERLPPNEPFADFCNAGAAYYFVERPIASRYAYPAYAATPAMQAQFIADLDRTQPRYLLASRVLGAMHVDGVALERRLPLLAAYFKQNYEPCADEVFGTMLRRKSPR
ncbi:MAG: hypothetical protein IPH13_07935 [Planctomycetes bacterium]|nr:hypothetical protein [Planctomycetota bacterium]MCC7170664.1 hypothetical protein [Planctomycetota bacterium]